MLSDILLVSLRQHGITGIRNIIIVAASIQNNTEGEDEDEEQQDE